MDGSLHAQLDAIDPVGAQWLVRRLERRGVFDATAAEIAADANIDSPTAQLLLDTLASAGVVVVGDRYVCGSCAALVPAFDEECPRCGADPGEFKTDRSYRRDVPRGRDVPWMMLIHGMNTRGSWQEEFSWRAALMHGRSIPVFSYKYGVIRPGVVFARRRRHLTQRTIALLRELAGDASDVHLGARPDVIAHSFGTWLIVHALLEDRTLTVGRIVLTGSILPTDFDWAEIAGQHEGVLNHCGGSDRVVRWASPFIAESGPSGVRGFLDSSVKQVTTPGWKHSDFFSPRSNLTHSFEQVWTPFLTEPT